MKIIQFFVKLIVRLCEGQNLTIVLTIILKTVDKAMKFMQFFVKLIVTLREGQNLTIVLTNSR